MPSDSQQEFILGALIGGAVGALAALLLAPLSGAALRREIGHGLGLLNGEKSRSKGAAAHRKAPPPAKRPAAKAPAKSAKGRTVKKAPQESIA